MANVNTASSKVKKPDPYYTLNSAQTSLVISCRERAPAVLYWGPRLSEATTPDMHAVLATRQEVPAGAEFEPRISLSPEFSTGFPGSAGIEMHRDGAQWAVHAEIRSVQLQDNRIDIVSECTATDIGIIHRLELDHDSDVLIATTEISNAGTTDLFLECCDAPTVPVPQRLNRILGFAGRWSNEFQPQTVARFRGSYLRENRSGRTSHDTFPGVVLHEPQTNETCGQAIALHLGWSGNHRLRIDEVSDGRAYVQLGELFFPGEIILSPGESYVSPKLYGAYSRSGFTGVSRCFHHYIRNHLTAPRMRGKTKPVHFNTWEATYFDLSMESLCDLADAAADVGAERFVLDDGWFRNRKSDDAGLGDWYVDENRFPDGLKPLTDYVNGKGMEFGLWVEPEMVNVDSDLFRSHPDWILSAHPAPLLMARHQLVLDLTRRDVYDYLFERLDALLREYPITYLKWDMNRDLSQPGGQSGRAVAHAQTLACYELLRDIRAAHPNLEIESCSSGGGRIDYGILEHTDRFWTSDSNDPLDRLRIQKGFSFFFPPELMGSHVGPFECHVTGRRTSLATRAGVAMFGDMGIEANLLEFSADDLAELKAAIALHKRHRALLFSGDLVRLDRERYENGFGIVSRDKREALFSYALLESLPHSVPGRYYFRDLQPEQLYSVSVVWPLKPRSYSNSVLDVIDGVRMSGDALMNGGMQLPILRPERLLVLHLQAGE